MKSQPVQSSNAPAHCVSDYGVELGEAAVPFVIAYDLSASPSEVSSSESLTDEEAAAVGLALLHSLTGNRRRGDFSNGNSLWNSEARAEMTRQRR
jgi:hypothetical protein